MFRNRENLVGMIYILFITLFSLVFYKMGIVDGGILLVLDGVLYVGGFFFWSHMQFHKLKVLSEFMQAIKKKESLVY